MKVLDLFSGIGGFSLGLEWAGMETIAMCEKDAFCRQILAKHWPDIPIHEDIRSLDGSQYKSVDVICGGFPCQPYSQAGRQLGNKDDRDLWSEMFRIIQESCPTWVIGENVSGFIGMALDDVCADLEDEGYQVQSFVIPACAVEDAGLWPTPTKMTGGEEIAPSHKTGDHGWNIGAAVKDSLSDNPIRLWPTPRASEYKDCGPVGSKSHTHMHNRSYLCAKVKNPHRPTGKLNPAWTEWLMGFPIGWTELNPLGTQSSLNLCNESEK